jgi:hypothetical protein
MKSLAFFLVVFQSINCFSEKYIPYHLSYEIVSDKYDKKIPNGKYLIEGTIYDYKYNENQVREKLSNVIVSAGEKTTRSDSKGYFRMTNQLKDSVLKFVLMDYNSSYLENYSLKNKHRIKLRIFMTQTNQETEFMVKKPVIYCYSDQNTKFDFQLISKGELTFAYPSLDSTHTWQMKLENNVLSDQNSQQNYPYLFWESQQKNIHFELSSIKQKKDEIGGSIISKANIVSYLDSTLTALGFNFKEKTDFITFWAPQMQKENYYLIQFVQNGQCDKFANYKINPTPNHLNRIYMLFAGNTEPEFPFEVVPQPLKPLERNGFYFVDWGGIEMDLSNYYVTEKTN